MERKVTENGVWEWKGGVISGIFPFSPIPAVWDSTLGRLKFGGQLESGDGGSEEKLSGSLGWGGHDQGWMDHGQGACVSLCLVHQAAPRPSPAQDPSSPYSNGAELRHLDIQVQRCEDILQQLRAVVPQMDMEGDRNVWIVKPGAKSRGRGLDHPLLPASPTRSQEH